MPHHLHDPAMASRQKRHTRSTSKCTLSLHVPLLLVESLQQCMQCCMCIHLKPNHALRQRICCTLGTDNSDTTLSIQAVRAGDVRTFQQEMDFNMHTFCVQVCSLYMAHHAIKPFVTSYSTLHC